MEKEFVPYEQALDLKELGFDGRNCFANWVERDVRDGGGVVIEIWNDENTEYNVVSKISAPIFSQVFRWFREKCNLDSEIYMNHELGIKFYTYLILQLDRAVITHKSVFTGKFKTYEEAEVECLKKLIEIVKEQK